MKPIPCLVLAAALAACAREIESSTEEEAADGRRTALAAAAPAEGPEDAYPANLYSERDADVHARIDDDLFPLGAAPVTTIHAELGDRVSAGQLLAGLEDDEAAVALEEAQAEADAARATYERTKALHERQVVSQAEYEDALFTHRRAQAALRRAQLNLARTQIRAPFAGMVSRRYVRVGDLAEPGKPLFRVTALAPLRARLLVPEAEAAPFRPGAVVRLTGPGGLSTDAPVILVGPTVDAASGVREVIVELKGAEAFTPGTAVKAQLAAAAPTPEP